MSKAKLKLISSKLKKASKAHAGQAKELDKAMKTEADAKGDDINQGKMDRVKKGEKDLVDPKPSLKSVLYRLGSSALIPKA